MLPTGTVTLAPAADEAYITIRVASDLVPEGDEAFQVTLSAVNATISSSGGIEAGMIVNDDLPPQCHHRAARNWPV